MGILNRYDSYRLWKEFDAVLGLSFEERAQDVEEAIPAEVQSLIDQRNAARKNKDWALSDSLRNQLIEMGYEVGDSPQGTTVKRRIV